jgi:soluble lytic murein transglycosylase-like protein
MSDVPLQVLIELARAAATAHGLPAELVCAVVEQESNWNPWAVRFEPAFERRYIHPALPAAPTTEELSLAISWGLMQTMGQSAREHGFKERFFTGLCHPEIGLEIGCRVLSHKWTQAGGSIEPALLRWNGGGNPNYPQQVMARMPRYASLSSVSPHREAT